MVGPCHTSLYHMVSTNHTNLLFAPCFCQPNATFSFCAYLPISLLLQSSLLMTILGELPISDGEQSIHGKIGYASQQAWIFNGTVKENILFGQDFNKDRYLDVINACALQKVRSGHYQFICFCALC